MGSWFSSPSAEDPGSAEVTIEWPAAAGTVNPTCAVGEVLRGTVVVTVQGGNTTGYWKLAADRLCAVQLAIQGKELSQVKPQDHGTDSKRRRKLICNDHVFLLSHVRLGMLPSKEPGTGKVPTGVYRFPFAIQLPTSIPATAELFAKDGKKKLTSEGYQILYSVSAHTSDGKNHPACSSGKRKWPPTTCLVSQPLEVTRVRQRSLENDPVTPYLLQPSSFEVRSWGGLMQAGNVTLGVHIPDIVASRGDLSFPLYLAGRNTSSAPIRRVQISLIQQHLWKTRHGDAEYQGPATQEKVLAVLRDVDVPSFVRQQCDRRAASSLNEQIFQDLMVDGTTGTSNRSLVTMSIPSHPLVVYDSYDGILVQVKHYLEIKILTGGVLANNPMIQIPIRIGAPTALPLSSAQSPSFTPAALTREEDRSDPQPVEATAVAVEQHGQLDLDLASAPTAEAFPMVLGIPLSDSSVSSHTEDRENVIVLGVDAIIVENFNLTPLSDLVPIPVSDDNHQDEPSLHRLLSEMRHCANVYALLQDRVQSTAWRSRVWSQLTAAEYGMVIAHIPTDFDQPRAAALLAPYLKPAALARESTAFRSGSMNKRHDPSQPGTDPDVRHCLTCEFAASAIRNTSAHYKVTTAERLVPLCSDLELWYPLIWDELTEWEQMIVQRVVVTSLESLRQ
jgi:hypothetical protein